MTTETKETIGLIGSDKVEGTAVYSANGENIGSIDRLMIEKVSGQVLYALVSFGGFFGMGKDLFPLPWSLLKYEIAWGGYRTDVSKAQLEKAVKYTNDIDWDWYERGRTVREFFGAHWAS